MYLKKLDIKNFRCIHHLELIFNEKLNILIGENNSGKTAIIDALRLCLSWGNITRDIYINKDDFYVDVNNYENTFRTIEFDLTFEIEKVEEAGIFIDLLSITNNKQELQIHHRYYFEEKNGVEKIKHRVWGGDNEGQNITSEIMELIYFIYLSALRNAVQDLRPYRGSRLGQLFMRLVNDNTNKRN